MEGLRREGFAWAWDDLVHNLRFTAKGITTHGAHLEARIVIQSIEGDEPGHMHGSTYILTQPAPRGRTTLAHHMANYTARTNKALTLGVWSDLIEGFCEAVIAAEEQTIPHFKVGRMPTSENPPDLIESFIKANDPTILYAPGGSVKGWLAVASAVAVVTGVSLGRLRVTKGVPLYLDFEDSEREINNRIQYISRGLSLPEFPEIDYLRCSRPLKTMVEEIAAYRDKIGANYLIVDSLDPASSGDDDWNARAREAFDAVRDLGMTTLIIAHVSKSDDDAVFGGIMNTNRARSAWKLTKKQEPGARSARVNLTNKKQNHGPSGTSFDFIFDWSTPNQLRIYQDNVF